MEKNLQSLPTSSRKKEQTRSGATKAKLATCRDFSLLGILHSVVSSQNYDSNVEINFCENKTDGQEVVKAPLICSLSEKSSNQRLNASSRKGMRKRQAGETIDLQLVESLNNVNDAVKMQSRVAPSQNDEIDTDMHFCKNLVPSLARMKIRKVLSLEKI